MSIKKFILIVSPYLNSIGGTELETLNTATLLLKKKENSKIVVFVPHLLDKEVFREFNITEEISFLTYPAIFQKEIFKKIDRVLKNIFKKNFSLIEFLFWQTIKRSKFSLIYVITQTSYDYYIPIIKSFQLKNVMIKNTGVNRREMSEDKKKILRDASLNIVTSQNQVDFFKNILEIPNTIKDEVILYGEDKLLNVNNLYASYTFGLLARISEEKNIEASIFLIEALKRKGYNPNLIIRGVGDRIYWDKLIKIVESKGLINNIDLKFELIPPNEIHEFYKKIKFFLVTSTFEGGPTTALEAMASGVPVLSYRVGAMEERLSEYPELLAFNLEDLVNKGTFLINLTSKEYLHLSQKIRYRYLLRYKNNSKLNFVCKSN